MDTSNKAPSVTIYTDGACSKNPGPGGWGVLLLARNKARYLSGYDPRTTNNKMEMYAAIVALRALTKPTRADLYTDSRYLVDGMTNWVHSWRKNNWQTYGKKPVLNQDLWMELIEESKKHDIQWNWVRGHSVDRFNSFVDFLATRAILKRDELDRKIDRDKLEEALDTKQISWLIPIS
jgi:ribonuclease HI